MTAAAQSPGSFLSYRKMNMLLRSLLGLALAFLDGANSFLPTPSFTVTQQRRLNSRLASCLHSSKEDNLEDMRRLLEASWNVDTMGAVPTNPKDAADAAATSIQSAMLDSGESLFFVDLLLPSYDISQGTNMYDEVLAVEFCIALAESLEGKSCLLVRDEKTRNSVNRVLEARERSSLDEDQEDEELVNDDDEEDEEEVEFFDDFADFGGPIGGPDAETPSTAQGDVAPPTTREDVDSFREQLMDKWDEPITEGTDLFIGETTEKPKTADAPPQKPKEKNSKPPAKKTTKPVTPSSDDRLYRLASLFGDAKISSGPDMIDQVVKAVGENGKPTEDEETIIILSAVEKDEMIAVRSLVAKYKGEKKIVLVNCQLDPLPRELIRANTVYSILPLVARPVVSEQNVFGAEKPQNEGVTPPKVVVMRRYPKDWEVYVDADGNGFELADVAKASQVRGKKGPPMEWIAGCVKRHIESKLGGR